MTTVGYSVDVYVCIMHRSQAVPCIRISSSLGGALDNNTRGSTALLRSPTDVPCPLLLQISRMYPDSSDHLQANASLIGIVIASHDSLCTICASHTAVAFATAASRTSAAAGCAHTLCRYFKRLALFAAWPISRNQPASPLTCEHLDVRPTIRERAGQRLLLRIQQDNTSARHLTA